MIFATAYTASLDSFNASAAVQTVTYCSNTPRLQSNGLPITHLSQILPENTSVSNTSLVRRQATIRVGDPCIGSINGATMCLANIPGVLFRCDGGYWQGDRCVDPATVTAPNTTCSLTDADKTVCYGASLLTCTGGSWIQQACPQGQNCILNSQRVGAQCLASTSIPSLSNNQIPLSVNFLSLGQGQVPQSCVHWFGDAYPANSPIYEKNANLSGIGKLDTTGVPPPNNGWIGLLLQHIEAPTPEGLLAVQQLTRLQMSEWALSGSRPELAEVLGLSPQQSPPLSTDQVQKLDASKILTPTFDVQSGLLGSIPKRLFASFDGTSVRFQQYPYFNVSGSFQSTTDVDDAIDGLPGKQALRSGRT
ncbi:hypothetical protein BC830DRAFT_1105355 [Chytriomyces sp. MP71]|nr:hypothetical protein BC830DRAFT_1105355 [Chytriomyces sp. MP71]